MEARTLHATMRWTAIALVIAPWVLALAGHPLPELFIAAGAVLLVQAAMIAKDYRGAADYHRRVGERRGRAALGYSDSRLARIFAGWGAALLALGVAGTVGLFG